MIRDTSTEAYNANKEKHPKCRQLVMQAFKDLGGVATLREVKNCLGWEVNRVSGRVTELLNEGKIRFNQNVKDAVSGRTVRQYKISIQQTLF